MWQIFILTFCPSFANRNCLPVSYNNWYIYESVSLSVYLLFYRIKSYTYYVDWEKNDYLAKEVKEIKYQTIPKTEKIWEQESNLFVPPCIRESVYILTWY